MTVDNDGASDAQARYWFVRNTVYHPSSEQRANFQRWLSLSPEHWRRYNALRRIAANYSDPAGSADSKSQ